MVFNFPPYFFQASKASPHGPPPASGLDNLLKIDFGRTIVWISGRHTEMHAPVGGWELLLLSVTVILFDG